MQTAAVLGALVLLAGAASAQTPKRIYLANDDHTDYMWAGDEATYRQAFLDMIDFYLAQADRTAGSAAPYRGRFNLDGTFWIWEYERNRSAADVARLVNRIKDGHISVPLNPLVTVYGGMPAEAVLRSMYYAGQLERRFGLRIPIAVAMEDQTHPYGLAGLWAGAGAKYSWKGVCGCSTRVPIATLTDRDHEIYWMTAPDGSRVLMKWHSLLYNSSMGGYAEARDPWGVVEYIDGDAGFAAKYPYRVAGAFGKGWDDLKTLTDDFITAAQQTTNGTRQVYVSNQLDFFQDFEATYGAQLPSAGASFGNEWELLVASMSEVSAGIKRALATLRAAEAMATLVALRNPAFLDGREAARDKAMLDLGLYFEHNWTADGPVVGAAARRDWQRRIADEVHAYVNTLHADAVASLGSQIVKQGTNPRVFVFNPLGWPRTDVAEIAYAGAVPVHVIDLATGQEVPSQVVAASGQQRLQIHAPNVPSTGYKVFEVVSGAGQPWSNAATVSGTVVENAFYRVTFSGRGAVTSWLDKSRGGRELVQARDGYALNDLGSGAGAIQVEFAGPVSVTLAATSSTPVAHTTRLTLLRDSRRVILENRITQNFGSTQSWRFSFAAPGPDVHHEEVGAILRARLTSEGGHYATRNARYDWLTLNHFVDVTGSDQVGITLSNADLYYMQLGSSTTSTLDTTTPLVKVLAGGQVDGPILGFFDQGGDTNFLQRFALQSHGAYDPVEAMRFALEHQQPLVAGMVTGGTAYPETSFSLLDVSEPGTLLWALKPADDGIDRGVVVRLWNLRDTPVAPTVRFATYALERAERTSHVETFEESAPVQDGALVASLAGRQLRTYALKPSLVSGSISGKVADATSGTSVAGVSVSVYRMPPDGGSPVYVASVTTDTSGDYALPLSPSTGAYRTHTHNRWGYIDELYDNLPCPGGTCAVGPGTPVSVTQGATTRVNFSLVMAPAASNDAVVGATLIPQSPSPFTSQISVVGATTAADDPSPPCGNGSRDKSVWFKFVPPAAGTVALTTGGSSYGTIVSTYTGNPGSFVPAIGGCVSSPSTLSLAVSAGLTYHFMVSNADAGSGTGLLTFTLTFVPIPVKAVLPAGDYDGDGVADVAVFRPTAGVWYLTRSRDGSVGVSWGASGDVPVPADYDGDGRTDVAVFRPGNGTWYIARSTGGSVGLPWGQAGDVPVPGDYDGDGKADVAVFRPSAKAWYVVRSSTGTATGIVWGDTGDLPVPADYDGDGRTDVAVFRGATHAWYVVRSSTNTAIGFIWGDAGDIPVVADYDGDGKADVGVFRGSTHAWYIIRSTTGSAIGFLWGDTGDVPVFGDYDGDGKADVAVFRPSTGAWYIQKSAGGAIGLYWGAAGDFPV